MTRTNERMLGRRQRVSKVICGLLDHAPRAETRSARVRATTSDEKGSEKGMKVSLRIHNSGYAELREDLSLSAFAYGLVFLCLRFQSAVLCQGLDSRPSHITYVQCSYSIPLSQFAWFFLSPYPPPHFLLVYPSDSLYGLCCRASMPRVAFKRIPSKRATRVGVSGLVSVLHISAQPAHLQIKLGQIRCQRTRPYQGSGRLLWICGHVDGEDAS